MFSYRFFEYSLHGSDCDAWHEVDGFATYDGAWDALQKDLNILPVVALLRCRGVVYEKIDV
jgi:hypothetical protein